jgi:hypothetical protein
MIDIHGQCQLAASKRPFHDMLDCIESAFFEAGNTSVARPNNLNRLTPRVVPPRLACGVEKYSTGCTVLYLDYTGSGGQGYSGVSRDASVSGGQHRRNHKWPIVTHLPAASPKPLRRVAAAITQRHAFVPMQHYQSQPQHAHQPCRLCSYNLCTPTPL